MDGYSHHDHKKRDLPSKKKGQLIHAKGEWSKPKMEAREG